MVFTNEVNENVLIPLVQRERQERLAISTAISEVLSKLNISIENLPRKCQELLRDVSAAQIASGMDQFDPIAISICHSREMTEKLNDDYEILKLKQKNKELQAKIDRNAKMIEEMRRDLAHSKLQLASPNLNLETVLDSCRQMKLKVASYEENCEKAKARFCKLSVPEHVVPASLRALASNAAELREEAAELRRRAEDVALVNQARHALLVLKK